jgi:hypothetical protein
LRSICSDVTLIGSLFLSICEVGSDHNYSGRPGKIMFPRLEPVQEVRRILRLAAALKIASLLPLRTFSQLPI